MFCRVVARLLQMWWDGQIRTTSGSGVVGPERDVKQLDNRTTAARRPSFNASITIAAARSTHPFRFRHPRRPQPADFHRETHLASSPSTGLREAQHSAWPRASCNRKSTKSASHSPWGRRGIAMLTPSAGVQEDRRGHPAVREHPREADLVAKCLAEGEAGGLAEEGDQEAAAVTGQDKRLGQPE